MTDARHAPDTLFLVIEEDFRIYKEGGVAPTQEERGKRGFPHVEEEEVPAREEEIFLEYAERLSAAELVKENPLSVEPVATDGGSEQAGYGFYIRTKKPKPHEFEQMGEELPDIVKIVTQASRHGVGELVWLTWDGGRGVKAKGPQGGWRQAHPAHASTAIAVSVQGAKGLQAVWASHIPRGHFDVSLLKALMNNETVRAAVPACFCHPSVGYRTHKSSILVAERPAMWDLPCVQEGTRAYSAGHQHRSLHEFCPKGHPPELAQVRLPEKGEDLRWFTYNPDPDPTTADEPVASAQGSKGKGKKGQRPACSSLCQTRRSTESRRVWSRRQRGKLERCAATRRSLPTGSSRRTGTRLVFCIFIYI